MITEMDKIQFKEFCSRFLDINNAKLGDEGFYQSLPLCIIDSVYSIGVKYEGTRHTVKKYCDYYGLQRIRFNQESIPLTEDQESIEHFIKKMESDGIEFFADTVFRNRQRTSSRDGILKADAVLCFAKVLKEYKVNYFQDIHWVVNNTEFEKDIRKIHGQGSGISLKYFLMLSGSENLIKPDRWIKKFIKDAIDKNVSDEQAQLLLSGVCEKLKFNYPHLTPRLLDNVIWKYQRGKEERKKNKQDNKNKACMIFNGAISKDSLNFLGVRERKITGRIVCPDDGRLEITINKNQDHGVPLVHGVRVAIIVLIDGATYEAGMRITGQGIPWICPDLLDLQGQKVRLADVLRKAGFEEGQKVFLTEYKDKAFKIDHIKEESKMSWWKIILNKVNKGDVLDTPGRGMVGLKKGTFMMEDINTAIIYVHSGKSRIPLEKKCFDAIEKAFQENSNLYLFVASLHDKPLAGSADELIRNVTGSDLARGNYICSILQHCGLVQYKMKGAKKAIALL